MNTPPKRTDSTSSSHESGAAGASVAASSDTSTYVTAQTHLSSEPDAVVSTPPGSPARSTAPSSADSSPDSHHSGPRDQTPNATPERPGTRSIWDDGDDTLGLDDFFARAAAAGAAVADDDDAVSSNPSESNADAINTMLQTPMTGPQFRRGLASFANWLNALSLILSLLLSIYSAVTSSHKKIFPAASVLSINTLSYFSMSIFLIHRAEINHRKEILLKHNINQKNLEPLPETYNVSSPKWIRRLAKNMPASSALLLSIAGLNLLANIGTTYLAASESTHIGALKDDILYYLNIPLVALTFLTYTLMTTAIVQASAQLKADSRLVEAYDPDNEQSSEQLAELLATCHQERQTHMAKQLRTEFDPDATPLLQS